MILRMQQRLCRHLGLEVEGAPEVEQLAKSTDVNRLVSELQSRLPDRD